MPGVVGRVTFDLSEKEVKSKQFSQEYKQGRYDSVYSFVKKRENPEFCVILCSLSL